uniref:ATP synthase complex subunit 8 n=1 Tax=Stegobium paniceum TaxID=295656 RepID=A0A343C0X2_STEPN|nr:ATP synthase F0 subunit 8 [Stegobium paniceum]ARH10873.1 ATP synthase F0 subunit 8 [Stegobium paniceum]QCI56372.1 ATP synthase F0 subunit 8 [Stegobium paniceum]QDH12155.1 ATP synthase F0 subunit 8 [Stegobium paniceum]
MPQMSPLSWTTLFIFFITIFIFTNCLNFFNYMYKSPEVYKFKLNSKINWKW